MTDPDPSPAAQPAAPGRAQPRSLGDVLEDRFEFETLLSDTSATLLAAASEQVSPAVEAALGRVRALLGADRCLLLSVSEDLRQVQVRLASYGPGVAPVPTALNLAELFPWAQRHLLVERAQARAGTFADLPPEAGVDRPGWERLGMVSCLTLPLDEGGRIRHLLMLQSVHQELRWPDALVRRLRVLGELLVGALERRDMLAGLRRAEARLRSGSALAGLGFFELDFEAGTAFADDRLRELCGLPAGRPLGLEALQQWEGVLHPDDRPRVLALRQQMLDGRIETYAVEYRLLHPVRGTIWIHHLAVASRRDAAGRALATYGVFRDVTERRQAEEDLADLGRRLLLAHEAQRALLARELHDDVTQRLAALAIDARRAELAGGEGTLRAAMGTLRQGLARLSEDVHALAYQLHPSSLEALGLADALKEAGERLGRRGPWDVTVDVREVPAGLPPETGLCLYRVAQEALTNVARHAGGRTVRLSLQAMDGGLLLAIQDDGIGFDPSRPSPRRSLGLDSMRERVRLVHGTLEIESAPGQGTAVYAWVPAGGGSP